MTTTNQYNDVQIGLTKGSARVIETQNLYKSAHKIHSPKKIIFSEPYEMVPSFIIDNNFKKGDCAYCGKKQEQPKMSPGFNIPFLPFLSSMLNGGANIGSMINMLGAGNKDSSNPFASMLSNTNFLNTISNLLFKSRDEGKPKHDSKSDDFNLKDYTRVE